MDTEKQKEADVVDTAVILKTLGALEDMVRSASTEVDGVVAPVRKSFFKRYPTIFLLLTTLGATAVFLGLERILLTVELLDNKPWLLFFFGVAILALTGRLAKKLD